MRVGIVTVLIYLAATKDQVLSLPEPRRSAVTHEDIRDAIISLVHLLQATTQKLERHELRERQLGDQLKKALGGLDSRERSQDSAIAAVNAGLARVEEKLTKIQGELDQKNEREKGSYVIDTVPLQSWMSNVEGMLNKQAPSTDPVVSKDQLEKMESTVNDKIDILSSIVGRIETQLLDSLTQLQSAVSNDGLYSKLESQLGVQEKWHNTVVGKLDHLESTSEVLLSSSNKETDNYTKEELAKIKNGIEYLGSDKLMNIDAKLQEIMRSTNQLQNVYKTTQDLKDSFKEYFSQAKNSQDELSSDVKSLTKAEQVLIQTADNVLDTRKRVEYGVQEILLGIGELVKTETKELNSTVNNRFNDISETILENQNGGVFNLSSKIDHEISQVWRQIGIMYQQLTNSANALSKLQLQTEQYLNGSLNTMDSMDGRVVEITGRVSDVKENLNYLMGRLLLVTQEFNQTKGDLATAFENLRNTFKSVRQDVKDLGSGPIPIEDEDNKL
ncbi:CAP-Gly domain-containing linker protein 1 [Halyomorpha halys]|uniref:CAP-Gly domain-containing linker protein 1 n=1 Tax=Halyomorpha halys TaxID=286706 RepID=UPI0006D4E4A3|nr:uncharacterized protein LOC106684989 [Halyomorpha halys]